MIIPYGSTVYGTNREDSDLDTVEIVPGTNIETGDDNKKWSPDVYQQKLDNHYIIAIECWSYIPGDFTFEVDLQKLRKEISGTASNSWVKAKKKMMVEAVKYPVGSAEHKAEMLKGKKSLFHCLRLFEFGIQIAKHGKVVDFGSANAYFVDMMYRDSIDWQDYDNWFRQIKNTLQTEFKKLAPKG